MAASATTLIGRTEAAADRDAVCWIAESLPQITHRLLEAESVEVPVLQLPAAQLRLAHVLYQQDGFADAGEPMGILCARLGARRNALTQAADRLIHNGLAERFGDLRDRRVVRLRLTPKGRDWVEARMELRRERLTRLWQALDSDERQSVLNAVHTLSGAVEKLDAAEVRTAHM